MNRYWFHHYSSWFISVFSLSSVQKNLWPIFLWRDRENADPCILHFHFVGSTVLRNCCSKLGIFGSQLGHRCARRYLSFPDFGPSRSAVSALEIFRNLPFQWRLPPVAKWFCGGHVPCWKIGEMINTLFGSGPFSKTKSHPSRTTQHTTIWTDCMLWVCLSISVIFKLSVYSNMHVHVCMHVCIDQLTQEDFYASIHVLQICGYAWHVCMVMNGDEFECMGMRRSNSVNWQR